MGNSYSSVAVKNPKFVTVEVDALRDRLNKLYNNRLTVPNDGLFEYLWDLKERALMEGSARVEVPSTWLDDLEDHNYPRSH
ncbi:MAG: hypothetical protein SGJ27_14445 [Candidatus Melainabacteria bacterium]|nr:hypothetical protein [Candidatus Melainabacteria bacterium]